MGANAQTAVPAFVAGEVLTAAEMTQVNTGIPVFATTTTRDAAFGGAGEKVLAQGQYAYIEATSALMVYSGSAWATVGASGLTLVKAQVVGSAVGSVAVSDAFSATYDSYIVTYNNGASSATDALQMQLGATTSGYYTSIVGNTWSTTASNNGSTTATNFDRVAAMNSTNGVNLYMQISSPFLSKATEVTSRYLTSSAAYTFNGLLPNTTSYTAFTLIPFSGTLTGGTIRVYGLANS
jgi:hypothetical protein